MVALDTLHQASYIAVTACRSGGAPSCRLPLVDPVGMPISVQRRLGRAKSRPTLIASPDSLVHSIPEPCSRQELSRPGANSYSIMVYKSFAQWIQAAHGKAKNCDCACVRTHARTLPRMHALTHPRDMPYHGAPVQAPVHTCTPAHVHL